MTTYELIEQAVLDSLGILEPHERREFEEALARAPEDVKEQVRDEQDRMLDLEDLLPDATPRAELRDMVLSAVRAAMREDAATPAVVGTIAPKPRGASFKPARRVSPVWRAAAVALGAATVAMVAVTYQIQQSYSQANDRVLVDALYENLGAEFVEDFIFGEDTQRMIMRPVSNTTGLGAATVVHNPDWSAPRLFMTKLKTNQNERLRLVVLDENDNIVREVTEFVATGELVDMEIPVNIASEPRMALYRHTVGDKQTGELLMSTSSEI